MDHSKFESAWVCFVQGEIARKKSLKGGNENKGKENSQPLFTCAEKVRREKEEKKFELLESEFIIQV